MLKLKSELFIGKGATRSCYRHPDDRSKCIKIFYPEYENMKKAHSREIKELRRLSKKETDLVIPKYHGQIETNLGLGHIFDLIEDVNGNPYPTVKQYLLSNPENGAELIVKLRCDLKKSGGVFHDLRTDNILVLENGKYAVIDGFGDWAFIKTCSIFPHLARKKVDRKLKHVERAVEDLQS